MRLAALAGLGIMTAMSAAAATKTAVAAAISPLRMRGKEIVDMETSLDAAGGAVAALGAGRASRRNRWGSR
nr:hypothetical protein GCM10025732_51100 [Glycomyces mayteni]